MAFSPGRATFSVKFKNEVSPYSVMAIINLAEINPNVTARGLLAICRTATELSETQPKLCATLKAVLSQSTTGMVESGTGRGAGVAAAAVNSCK